MFKINVLRISKPATYLGRWPMHKSLVLVHTINHKSPSSADVIDAVVGKLLDASSFNHNIKAIGIVILELLPLWTRVLTIKLNVFVSCTNLFGNVHLDALISGKNYARRAILLEKLGKDDACWPSAQEQNFDTERRV